VVEVKRRATIDAAICALTPRAAGLLQRAAHQLAAEVNQHGRQVSARVDLIALAPRRWPRHIPGV
jgi:putative endonuclease